MSESFTNSVFEDARVSHVSRVLQGHEGSGLQEAPP